MTIQRVKCPKCNAAANVPAAMATVRCPKCGHIWDPNATAEEDDETSGSAKKKSKRGSSGGMMKMVGGVIGGLLVAAVIGGTAWYMMQSEPRPQSAPTVSAPRPPAPVVADQPQPAAEPYRVIKLSESVRQQIYRDYRTAANTSVDKPIPLPKKWNSRQALDATLDKVLEREITLHASIHNISNEDVIEVLKEGNAKQW